MMERFPNNDVLRWPYTLAEISSVIAIIAGVFSLLGWTFYFWLPPSLLQLATAIKPNTAICFILAGAALWIRCEKSHRSLLPIAEICSGAVFLMGFLTLFQYLFDIDMGIDQGLFHTPLSTVNDFLPPGRMSPFFAINFVLIGFTLFFLDNRTIRYQVHQLLIMIVIMSTYLEFLLYFYSVGDAHARSVISQHPTPAMPIVIIFLLLSIGIFFARPYKGIAATLTSSTSGGKLARLIIPPTLLLPMILGYLALAGLRANLFERETGLAFLIMSIVIFFTILILIYAFFVNKFDMSRQRAEFELLRNQLQLQAILDQASAVISIYDLDGRFSLVNKQFEKTFHISATEVVGRKVSEVLPNKLGEQIKRSHEEVLRARMPIAVEEILNDGNETYTYLSNKFPIFDANGIPTSVCNISTDVTEINRMHTIMREREERLSIALKSANAGTWMWDVQNDSVVWDEYLFHLFGLKPGAIASQYTSMFNFIHPEDRQKVDQGIKSILAHGIEYESEFRIIKPDGTIHYLATRGQVHRDNFGTPIRLAGVSWDITERKHNEEELHKAKDRAERLAEEAKKASHAKSAFLATMSHEIRTPLSGIIGMTELLLDTPVSSEQHKSLETIRTSGEALLSVINNILDFSKIESERMELENMRFDLHALVEDTVELLAMEAHRKGIAIGTRIDPNVPAWLNGDPAKLRQVLVNLIGNAEKFTDSGEISLKLKKLPSESPNDNHITIQFEVSDSGIGITPEVRSRLFQPFTQGDISTSRKYGGTGLGLVISKRLIELMGGHIDVESLPGHGSRFIFTIKLTESLSRATPLIEYQLLPELHGLRVLCVDDSAINREVVKQDTELWKMRCDTAANAAEALSMMKKAVDENDPYILILIDHLMPGMTGLELVHIMRQLPETKDVSVILLSPLGMNIHSGELKKLGIAATLTKPLRAAKLQEGIQEALQTTDPSKRMASKQAKTKTHKAGHRILIAEDNPVNKEMTLRILAKLGYEADAANNGQEVLRALHSYPYDLVLMDCQMPEMDGYTTAQEIRRLETNQHKRLPIIAMTAHALRGDREKCLAAGMDDYISKPISIKTLKTKIERWLAVNSANVEAESAALHSNPFNIIDIERIKVIFGDDVNGIQNFLQILLKSLTELLEHIETAIQNKDVKNARSLFHQLKGSTSNAGIMQIQKLCIMAEEKLGVPDWEKVEEYYQAIVVIFKRLEDELQNLPLR